VGHHRAAAHVLERIGVPPLDGWRADLPPGVAVPWLRARGGDLRWARRHLAPWISRRLRGRSSGDLIGAKRPALDPLADEA
jgi:hypothetical protein